MDHVYPLSLGGSNQFTVWRDLSKNSVMGSEVDGEVVDDPLLEFAIRDSGVKGHGGTAHVQRWRHVKMDDRPLQITYEKDRIVVWDAHRELRPEEYAGRSMTARLKIGMHTALRFLAKAALGGGYFLYGDAFRTAIDCDPLREAIFLILRHRSSAAHCRSRKFGSVTASTSIPTAADRPCGTARCAS